ncbi:uncharacterized protein L3040_003284 [Drepanopeziza brunnea f. sp. 'multigermtubi']|uniref:uncharacterized protein n=1 Tax=Drepanopeziza brunnea f. sp. 'multigermtubi' TaxID=698441 RepID=UPI0023A60987|nr:hypothetical protein L3040_003284 [Drepanopeziza brunnea f. sp. 'multigermtubi']
MPQSNAPRNPAGSGGHDDSVNPISSQRQQKVIPPNKRICPYTPGAAATTRNPTSLTAAKKELAAFEAVLKMQF